MFVTKFLPVDFEGTLYNSAYISRETFSFRKKLIYRMYTVNI